MLVYPLNFTSGFNMTILWPIFYSVKWPKKNYDLKKRGYDPFVYFLFSKNDKKRFYDLTKIGYMALNWAKNRLKSHIDSWPKMQTID